MLFCGGFDVVLQNVVRNVNQVEGTDLKRVVKTLPSMLQGHFCSKAVCVKSDVYVFGGRNENFKCITSVERYSRLANTWNKVGEMPDERVNYCVCAFTDKIFILGGFCGSVCYDNSTNSCLEFNTKDHAWKQVARMNEARSHAACAVFEGSLVIAGGWHSAYSTLNSVESYDVFDDKWSPMPNMIEEKHGHKLVVVRNKLFVIGRERQSCEVFDSNCKRFVIFKSPGECLFTMNNIFSIGNVIYTIKKYDNLVLCYNTETNDWTTGHHKLNIVDYSGVKIPWF